MKGTLYGVGVGPGDPKLMTVLAAETIKTSRVIAVPAKNKEEAVSYRIAEGLIPEICDKECLCFSAPMTKEPKILNEAYEKASEAIIARLEAGEDVAYLTLGDPTVYSTYIYVHRLVTAKGYNAQIINGITSFCAAAVRLNDSLSDRSEQLHIIPSSYNIEDALDLSGTKILMKAASKMAEVKRLIKTKNLKAAAVENCGMPNERIYKNIEEIPDDAGYYSVVIIKE